MTKTIRFLLNANQFPEDQDAIMARLRRHLQALRAKTADPDSEPGWGVAPSDDLDGPVRNYGSVDVEKIRRRADAIVKLRRKKNGLGHLDREIRQRLLDAPRAMRLDGPANEHAADELASKLYEESPWLAPAIEVIWQDMRRFAREGLGLKFRPILLDGPSGIGKTHLARRIGELSGLPALDFDVGSGSEGFRLTGLSKGWGTAQPSQVVERILDSGCANPIVFVDEIDRAGVLFSKGGLPTSVITSLLVLLEPRSAEGWECPFYQLKFDMSHVNWILASNRADLMPEPLRTRLRIVSLPGMRHIDLNLASLRQCRLRGLSDQAVEDIARVLSVIPPGHSSLNMRTLSRLLDDREVLERKPTLN